MPRSALHSASRSHSHGLLLAAAMIAVVCASFLRAAPPNTQRTFEYLEQGKPGTIVEGAGGIWTQTNPAGTKFTFKYAGASDDYVELLDAPRDISLRIYTSGFMIRSRGQTTYRPYAQGQWVFTKVAAPKTTPPKAAGTGKLATKPVPARNGMPLKLVYFVPSDRKPIPQFREKILVVLDVVEQIYRAEFERRQWRFDGFPFELDPDGKPAVHLILAKKPAREYNDYPMHDFKKHYANVTTDIVEYFKNEHRTQLTMAFAETYEEGPANVEWAAGMSAGVRFPIGGGFALCSGWILKDEFCATDVATQLKLLNDETPIVGRAAMHTRKPDSPRFEFIEDGFGAVARELGHAFGLYHDSRLDDREIMGQGSRRLRNNFDPTKPLSDRAQFSEENARILRISPFLNSDLTRGDVIEPQLRLTIENPTAPTTEIKYEAADDRALKGIMIFDRNADTIVFGEELKGKQTKGVFTVTLKRDADGKFSFRALLLDGAGNRTTTDVPAEVK